MLRNQRAADKVVTEPGEADGDWRRKKPSCAKKAKTASSGRGIFHLARLASNSGLFVDFLWTLTVRKTTRTRSYRHALSYNLRADLEDTRAPSLAPADHNSSISGLDSPLLPPSAITSNVEQRIMATTANAPAPFGPPQTPTYQDTASWVPEDLIKPEPDTDQVISSPTRAANSMFPDFANIDPVTPLDVDAASKDRSMSAAGLSNVADVPDMTDFTADVSQVADSVQADLDSYAAEEAAVIPNVEPMQAYAKLQFSDGDFYVSTQAVELGRDMSAMKFEKKMKKQERRRKELEAARAAGDDTLAIPSNALTRRTLGMSGSNASESGGIIGNLLYSGSEDENKAARRRRKKLLAPSNVSSESQSHSVAPASLHTNPVDLSLATALFDGNFEEEVSQHVDVPFVPIHPGADRSITGISRKHIRIEYNGEKAYWELHVLGRNGAFIDEETYVGKGEVARLRHNTTIQVQGIDIVFKLPDNARDEEVVADVDGSDSELSNLASDLDENLSDPETPAPKERLKLKLSLSKRGQALEKETQKAAKLSLKAAKDKTKGGKTIPGESAPAAPAEPADIRPSIEEAPSTEVKPKVEPAGVPATPAPDLPPGSILAGLAPEEIPQKRKGPGRPPKNGVMSKRDEAIIKRKKKELQKAGQAIPPLTELLAMARAEAGTTKKGDEVGDGEAAASAGMSATPGGTAADGTQQSGDAASKTQTAPELEAAKARKQAKSPSPQKPESEYTEEELKKPQKTYVVLIHDALSASTTGIMDLQQIYDAIQKMYPFYKYRSQTQGWQSSIRHNLIGSEAFEEAGKIGKGRLWKINPNYPIDKEKKRRAPTPPTDKPAYPYYQNGQYNNNNGYPPYRPSPYGTPYGPPTTAAPPNGARPPPPPPPQYGQQRNGTYYSPYASNPPAGQQQNQSPYGAQSRPPYAHAHAPNQPGAPQPPNGAAPGPQQGAPGAKPPGPPPQGHAPMPAGRGQPPPRPGQAPPPPGQAQQPGAINSDDTIEEIMSYHKRYLGGFKPGAEQDAARDLFRKAVSRHIDHNKEHGEFSSEEEKKVADVIGEIIRRNKAKLKTPAPQARPPGAPGPPPQAGAPHAPGAPGMARPPQAPMHAPGGPHPPGAQQGQAPRPMNGAAPQVQGAPRPPMQQHPGSQGQVPQPQLQQPRPGVPQPQPGVARPAPATIDLTGPAPAQGVRPVPGVPSPAPRPGVPGQAPPAGPPRVTPTGTPTPGAAGVAPRPPTGPPGNAPVGAPRPAGAVASPAPAGAPRPPPVAGQSPAPGQAPAPAAAVPRPAAAPAVAPATTPAAPAPVAAAPAQAPAVAGVKRPAEDSAADNDAKKPRA